MCQEAIAIRMKSSLAMRTSIQFFAQIVMPNVSGAKMRIQVPIAGAPVMTAESAVSAAPRSIPRSMLSKRSASPVLVMSEETAQPSCFRETFQPCGMVVQLNFIFSPYCFGFCISECIPRVLHGRFPRRIPSGFGGTSLL